MAVPYLIIDIETGRADEETIAARVATWKPPGNLVDPEKTEARRKEFAENAAQKSSLWDESPIVSVGLYNPELKKPVVFIRSETEIQVEDALVVVAGDEKNLLSSLGQLLNQVTDPETVLSGWNVEKFDFRKLRLGYGREDLPLPRCLTPSVGVEENQPIFDLMKTFSYKFSIEARDCYTSLSRGAQLLGIEDHKNVVDGSKIPILFNEGRVKEIAMYNAPDVLLEDQIFQRLSAR